jgi:hypothetical protein
MSQREKEREKYPLPGMSGYNYSGTGEKKKNHVFISPLEMGNYKIHIFFSLSILVFII